MYWEAFEKFQAIPEIKNLEDNKKFCMVLKDMLDAHIIVIQKFAMGIRETACHMEPHQCDKFLNEMLRSRIGRRVISQQHLRYSDIWEGRYPEQKHVSGIINTQCSALETVQKCTDLAGRLFKDNYQLNPPHVEIEGHFGAKLTYISGHLQYIIYELLKNSMQHTVKKHSKLPQNNKTQVPSMAEEAIAEAKKIKKTDIKNSKLPPIKVTIGQSDTEVMFRISDQGGGIPNDLINNVWSYWYVSDRNQTNFEEKPHLENLNLGMGLCIARAYANYWGGTMHGYGTDAYVKISTENEKEVTESKVRSNK
ncbi:hypothetical protein HK099_007544 [Clydaea vesicula]|uniref:Protein-serine/threonine kinase n=1 Tax=Clydaea vesicula TaxID=447962 RepID=A0AAD5U5D3_9FUNG|nr:hypothetical protein HK099_007544 [Clydaea vesicula]